MTYIPIFPHTFGFKSFTMGLTYNPTTWNLTNATYDSTTNSITSTISFGESNSSSKEVIEVAGLTGLLASIRFTRNGEVDYGYVGFITSEPHSGSNRFVGLENNGSNIRPVLNSSSSGYPDIAAPIDSIFQIDLYDNKAIFIKDDVPFHEVALIINNSSLYIAVSPYYDNIVIKNIQIAAQQTTVRT